MKRFYGVFFSDRFRRRGDLYDLIKEPLLFAAYSYLTHGPHRNIAGLFHHPADQMAGAMGVSVKKVEQLIGELEKRGLVMLDVDHDVIFVPEILSASNYMGHTRSSKQKKGILNVLTMHHGALAAEVRKCLESINFGKVLETLTQPIAIPLGPLSITESREQGTENKEQTPGPQPAPEGEPQLELVAPSGPSVERGLEAKTQRVLELWNECSSKHLTANRLDKKRGHELRGPSGKLTALSKKVRTKVKEFGVEVVLECASVWWTHKNWQWKRDNNALSQFLQVLVFEQAMADRPMKGTDAKTVPQKPARLIEVRRRLTRSRSRLLVPDGVTVEQMKAQVRDGVEYDLIEDDQEEARG